MSRGASIDYDALAKQAGGTPAVDYDALATQHGGESATTVTPSQDSAPARFLIGANEGFGIPESVSRNPSEAWQGLKAAVSHPGLEYESLKNMYHGMTQAQQNLIDRAYRLQHSSSLSDKANGFVTGVYSAIPLFGPAIVDAVDTIHNGDTARGLGKLTAIGAQVTAPAKAPEIASAASRIADLPGEAMSALPKLKEVALPNAQTIRNAAGVGDRMVRKVVQAANEEYAAELSKVTKHNAATEDLFNKSVQRVNDSNAKLQASFSERAANTAAKQEEANRLASQKNSKIQATYDDKLATAEQLRARANYDADFTNKQAAQDYVDNVAKVQQINRASEQAVGRRAQLASKITTDSQELGARVKELEEAVRHNGNAKYDAVSEAVAGDTIPADALAPAVRNAEKNILQGSSENIKQFRELLAREGAPVSLGGAAEGTTPDHPLYQQLQAKGVIPKPEGLTFKDLQGYYTELGAKMAQGGLPGDVYRAIKSVREELGNQMDAMAERHGAGKLLEDAQAYWKRYENTFNDMRAVAQGGSPVARIVRAKDPAYMGAPVLGKASARAVDMLKQYDQDLASHAAGMARDYTEMQHLPTKIVTKELPSPPTIVKPKSISAPEAPEFVSPPIYAKPKPPALADLPEPPEYKSPPETPDVIEAVRQARQDKLLKSAESLNRLSHWDLLAAGWGVNELFHGQMPLAFTVTFLRHGLGKMLERPGVIEWLTKPTPHDFELIKSLGPQTTERMQSAVTQSYLRLAKKPGFSLPAAAKSFLRPAQVSAIIQASSQYKKPEDVMMAMKNGELSQVDGSSILQRMRGKQGVTTKRLNQ